MNCILTSYPRLKIDERADRRVDKTSATLSGVTWGRRKCRGGPVPTGAGRCVTVEGLKVESGSPARVAVPPPRRWNDLISHIGPELNRCANGNGGRVISLMRSGRRPRNMDF